MKNKFKAIWMILRSVEYALISDEGNAGCTRGETVTIGQFIKALCARFRPMVLPEKKDEFPEGRIDRENVGFNACIDEVIRLNGSVSQEKELREALEGLLSLGRKDLSNPKYDEYFAKANQVLNGERGQRWTQMKNCGKSGC